MICPELPWIAASPDRLAIGPNGICPVEIKCPDSCKNDLIIDVNKLDYLEKDAKGNIKLTDINSQVQGRGPLINFQIQLQILFSKAETGYLFVWIPNDYIQITIHLDIGLI